VALLYILVKTATYAHVELLESSQWKFLIRSRLTDKKRPTRAIHSKFPNGSLLKKSGQLILENTGITDWRSI